jgi:hypothetical protein
MRNTWRLGSALVVALAGCPATREDRFADIAIDPTIFYLPTPGEARVAHAGGLVARDQVILLLDDAADEAARSAAIEALDATVVGEIPPAGIVQLAADAPDEAAIDALVERARTLTGVAAAAPNRVLTVEACELGPDNEAHPGPARCAAEDVGWYRLDLMAPTLREAAPPRRVRVAVLDTGLDPSSGQFDLVEVFNLAHPGEFLLDTLGHGTRVAGLIAADDHDGGVAGLASTVLGDALELLVAAFDETTMGSFDALAHAAGDAHADVANMSLGFAYPTGEREEEARETNAMFRSVLAAYPDMLLVTSSDNQARETTADDYTPAGIELPNFLAVGGTAACRPNLAWSRSGWGSSVGLAAPAERVAVMSYVIRGEDTSGATAASASGPPLLGNGNSYSSPIVASAAAIVRAFDPALSPAEVVSILRASGAPTDPSIGGVVVDMPRALLETLLRRGLATSYIDVTEPFGEADPASLVLHRVCGGASLTVRGLGVWQFDAAELEGMGAGPAGLILDASFTVGTGDAQSVSWMASSQEGVRFDLDADWAISEDGPVLVSFSDENHFGGAVSGTLRFHACTITQRQPGADDRPMVVEVELTSEGVLEITQLEPLMSGSHEFMLTGTMPMAVFATSPEVIETLERLCVGGYDR